MNSKHVALVLAAWGLLAAGLGLGYKIGTRNPVPLQHQFDVGWNRGYASGVDAGIEQERYNQVHTPDYKRGWTECMEQF